MAKWSGNKVNPEQINNGNEYSVNDNVSVEELNGIVNNSFKAQKDAEQALELATGANKANGTVVEINGEPQGTWDATAVSKITNSEAEFLKIEYGKQLNKFDISQYRTTSGNGTFYITDKGAIRVSPINSTDVFVGDVLNYNVDQYYIDVKENANYTLSFVRETNISKFNLGQLFVSFIDGNNNFIEFLHLDWGCYDANRQYLHFTTPTGTSKIFVRFGYQIPTVDTSLYVDFKDIMINEGGEQPYQEYQGGDFVQEGNIKPILLWQNGNQFAELGETIVNLKKPLVVGKDYALYYKYAMQANSKIKFEFKYGGAGHIGWITMFDNGTYGNFLRSRLIEFISDTQVKFYDNWTNNYVENLALVPTEIYELPN
jgi:hypothetical protein